MMIWASRALDRQWFGLSKASGLFCQVDNEFVGGHHDGSVGDLPQELGQEAAVEGIETLLDSNQPHRLSEGAIAASLFP